jgi:hypothetical protein
LTAVIRPKEKIVTETQQPIRDSLEAAISAFREMSVPDRPPDEQVRARLVATQTGVRSASIPPREKRRFLMRLLVAFTLTAALLLGGFALFLRKTGPSGSAQVAAPVSSGTMGDATVRPLRADQRLLGAKSRSLDERVAEAQVIVVGTALNSAPAPPNVPGDRPEVLIRFKVMRVLKGDFAAKEITTRTPTDAAEFIGKERVILLSPEYVAGKHQFAGLLWIKAESEVKAVLSKGQKQPHSEESGSLH